MSKFTIHKYTFVPKPIDYEYRIWRNNGFALVVNSNRDKESFITTNAVIDKALAKKGKNINQKIGSIKSDNRFNILSENGKEVFRKAFHRIFGTNVPKIDDKDIYMKIEDVIDLFENGKVKKSMLCRFDGSSAMLFDVDGNPLVGQGIPYDYTSGQIASGTYDNYDEIVKIATNHPKVSFCSSERICGPNTIPYGHNGLLFVYVPTAAEMKKAWEWAINNDSRFPTCRFCEYFFGHNPQVDPFKIKKWKKPEREDDDYDYDDE